MSINLSVPEGSAIPELKPKLTVIGIGGAGGNAINNMIRCELEGVEFVVANTDAQALEQSQAESRIQLGVNLTQGLGAGSQPEVGRAAAEEAIDEVLAALSGSHMAFIAAGMGGGTGTGAAPAIAKAAKEAGILTVAVVTKPFQFEGAHRMRLAESGIQELEQYVDTLIIIPNQNLFRVATENTTFADAFGMADEVLYSGVRGVTDLMVMPGLINLDFADIRSVMSEMGKAMMGTGEAEGERRALDAAEAAIANPLLDDTSMKGAKGVLINITGGTDITLFEVDEAASRIRAEVDQDAYIIIGSAFDNDLQGKMRVSVVATGIDCAAKMMPQPTVLQVTDSAKLRLPVLEENQQKSSNVETSDTNSTDHIFSASETPLDRLVREAQTGNAEVVQNSPIIGLEKAQGSGSPLSEANLKASVNEVFGDEKITQAAKKQIDKEARAEVMPTATPHKDADEAFIPHRPETSFGQEQAANESTLVTDLGEAQTTNEDERPSLFERVTRTGRAAIGRVTPDNSPQEQIGAADLIEATSLNQAERSSQQKIEPQVEELGDEAQKTAEVANLEMIEIAKDNNTPVDQVPDEEDLLDIPAFLRRQAN